MQYRDTILRCNVASRHLHADTQISSKIFRHKNLVYTTEHSIERKNLCASPLYNQCFTMTYHFITHLPYNSEKLDGSMKKITPAIYLTIDLVQCLQATKPHSL